MLNYVATETRESVALSFLIVDRIHDILEEKGLKKKGLALKLDKSEAEIGKWMRDIRDRCPFHKDCIYSSCCKSAIKRVQSQGKLLELCRAKALSTQVKV